MKVLLKEDVDNLGFAGEVHKVAPGYGRNYLIPKNMAIIATPKTLKQADVWRKKAESRREELKAEYKLLAAKIRELTLTFTARAGANGRLYGSITTAQITDKMNETLGTDIDRRKVGNEPLRQLGPHDIVVRLSGDFQPNFTVMVESEEAEGTVEVATDDAEVVETEASPTEETETDTTEAEGTETTE